MTLVLKGEAILSLVYVPYTIPTSKVQETIYHEFQACKILSVTIYEGVAVVELEDHEKISTLLETSQLAHIRVDYVNHHSALLPGWLSLDSRHGNFTIIHIDAHNDLGMPNLLHYGEHVIDRWTGNIVHPAEIPSVLSAIDSTAIEIGSYLTMALYWLPVTHLIWVCPEDKCGTVRNKVDPRGLRLQWSYSDPLNSSVERLGVQPVDDEPYNTSIQIVKNVESLCKIVQGDTLTNIIVDLDLDYFDNSSENSNLCDRSEKHIPPMSDEWMRTQHLRLEQLLDAMPFKNIISIGIACSPGFCPVSKAEVLKKMVNDYLLKRSNANYNSPIRRDHEV